MFKADELTRAQAEIYKALGHPSRLTIVKALAGGPRCVCELVDRIESSQPTISKHLDILLNAGVVRRERQGVKMMYELALPCLLQTMPCVSEALTCRRSEECVSA